MLRKHWDNYRSAAQRHLTNYFKNKLSEEEISDRIRIANRLLTEWEILEGVKNAQH